MKCLDADIVIVGAGPVGLMCAYLSGICGLKAIIIDKSEGPISKGRADALNARTLQFLQIAGIFDEIYPLGKKCNTSSVWANGHFVLRKSEWWDELEGCEHKHFLMLGQSHIEKLLDQKLSERKAGVKRSTSINKIQITADGCLTELSNGEKITSRFVIGADGSRSFVRNHFRIPFKIVRPEITWAVIDGVIETDFPKVPEIIVFQVETSDVAWIPREGDIDRFYVRMDNTEFTLEEALEKINRAMMPHTVRLKEIEWYSRFSVKEAVAEKFSEQDRVFIAGDACHVHSVNGGQGLNTGIADAFNLIWKLNMVIQGQASLQLLRSYEAERQPVAKSVIETSGKLVRSTKFSCNGTHAQDYVDIVKRHAGNITGMGIRYGCQGLAGTRLYDFEIFNGDERNRIYSLLDYTKFTLIIFHYSKIDLSIASYIKTIQIYPDKKENELWSNSSPYSGYILVRPDSYIEKTGSIDELDQIFLS